MSGLGLLMSIARDAMAAQQYGIAVTGHNIANVNTEGYSRQSTVNEAKEPMPYAGLLLGRGVDTTQVLRVSDQFIEKQLRNLKSDMSTSQELENYMQVLEGLFNENAGTSISTMLSEFWNLWHDIANNPSGSPERIALYEHGILMSDQFNILNTDLTQLQTDLTMAINTGVTEINQITNEIAQVNDQLVGMETGTRIANDLRDKRNTLTSELAHYIDVNAFEQENGSLSIVTAKGCILVQGNDNFNLMLGGDNGDRIMWESSGGGATGDITDNITKGRLGGWLEMRDEIIAKYKLDLNAVAEEFIWTVNQQHSQGVGLAGFSSVTGTYVVTDSDAAITASGLSYQDKVDDSDKTFKIWLFDTNGDPYDSDPGTAGLQGNPITITVTADMTVNQLVTAIDNGTGLQASLDSQNRLNIGINTGEIATLGSLVFSDDNSNVLAALGINTLFTGANAGGMDINDKISLDKNYIAAAQIDADTGDFGVGNNTNALAIADLQYESKDISLWTCDRIDGDTKGSLTATIDNYYHSMISSIGIKSSSISRNRAFNAAMANKMGELRDSISAVSLDEEMTNLIKFQHAFQAAAKLISVSDEMLNTLLEVK